MIAAAFLLVAGPAIGAPKPPPPNPTVLMSPVALPIVVDHRLVNYVFVTLRIGLSPNADPQKMRTKEPFFRDALVRAGHRQPFVRDDNYTLLDDDRLKASILHDATAIVGPGMIVSVQILREQSQHYDGLPKPKAGPSAR
jgi:hypothetical protein